MQSRRNIFLWILYDFANSIVSIVFFLYFSQWMVIDRGLSDLSFNLTFTVTAIGLFLTVPFTGVVLDRSIRRITGLRYITVCTALFYGTCAILAVSNLAFPALVLFTLGLYSYLLSFTCYTPLLQDISPPNKRGLVSGLGIAANYAGQIAGLLMALPFSSGAWSFFGASPRAETLLPSVLIFFILALPMLLFFSEPKRGDAALPAMSLGHLFRETKSVLGSAGVSAFLLAYFLFNDAILTASNNFPIFMEQVWHVSDATKTFVLLGILVASVIGGAISGLLADRFGHKRTLFFILFGWIFILPLVAFLTNFTLFVLTTTVMGLWFGANWTVSRSVMSYLAPAGRHNLAFAYFGLAERASSLLGPIVWGTALLQLSHIGPDRYRYATLLVTGFIVLGLLVLSRVRSDRPRGKNPAPVF